MSGHNVREEISSVDPVVRSAAATGTTLEERGVFGVVFDVVETSNSQTRKLAAPSASGQVVSINTTIASGHTLTVTAPTGTTFDGTNATITFTQANGAMWMTLISFNVGGTLMWRVLGKGAGAALTT